MEFYFPLTRALTEKRRVRIIVYRNGMSTEPSEIVTDLNKQDEVCITCIIWFALIQQVFVFVLCLLSLGHIRLMDMFFMWCYVLSLCRISLTLGLIYGLVMFLYRNNRRKKRERKCMYSVVNLFLSLFVIYSCILLLIQNSLTLTKVTFLQSLR